MNAKTLKITTKAFAIIGGDVTPYDSMEEAMEAVRKTNLFWNILGVRELDGETVIFCAAQSKKQSPAEAILRRITKEFEGWDIGAKFNPRTNVMRITARGTGDTLDLKVIDANDFNVIRCKSEIQPAHNQHLTANEIIIWMDAVCCL